MNALRMYRVVVLSGLALGTGTGCSADTEPADTPRTDAGDAGEARADGQTDGALDVLPDRDPGDGLPGEGSDISVLDAPRDIAPSQDVFPDEGPARVDAPRDIAPSQDVFPDEGPPPDIYSDRAPQDAFPDEGPDQAVFDAPLDITPPQDAFPDEGGDHAVFDAPLDITPRQDAFPDEGQPPMDAPSDLNTADGPPSDGPDE
jgi:hypothetical protein